MTVAAILRHKGHEIASVAPTTKISNLTNMLAERRIGAVLVRDSAGQMMGIVSERDIVRCLARDGAACLDMTAAQLMTRLLHTVTPATSTDAALALMTDSRVRHLPVMEGDTLVGMISIGDVVKAQLDAQAQEVDSLKAYVSGTV
jgi:CBS domain-containing protein